MSTMPLPALIAALSTRDLSDPREGSHAIGLIVDEAVASLTQLWECPARIVRSRPIVPISDNYDLLGYPADAIAREVSYTRYVSDTCVLRSHTSAGVPGALRALAAEPDPPDQLLLALPGICHRRDSIDRLHTGTPHQLDLWLLRNGGRRLDHTDLSQMVTALVGALTPGRHWRWTQASHPYTSGGRQVDVIDTGEPVEIAECGLAAPQVLRAAGLDGSWSGLALGMGLDRMVMLRKAIPDIRLLRSKHPQVRAQLNDLSTYEPVSTMPAARRDLSVAVDADADVETLGDRVREALGPDADLVAEVTVLSTARAEDLPGAARDRLGIGPGQLNVLLRVVLQATDRTLTGAEVNALRDRIYAAVHEGSAALVAAP